MPIHPRLVGQACYHKYEIAPGLFTPGKFVEVDPKRCLDELGVPGNLTGLRALDIGAWDGPFTFEMERRGAQVTALDIQDPDVTVFNIVKEIKNSSATYVRGSVYDALPETLGTYDVVLFVGVYYHLKNPVMAIQRIRRLLSDTGTLFIEGASTTEYLAEYLISSLGLPHSTVQSVREIVDRLPISCFDYEHKIYPHWSNWWFPTTRCLEVMLLDSGFRNVCLELKKNGINNYADRRLSGRAEADPEKADPAAQKYEHDVATTLGSPPEPSRFDKLLARLPSALHPSAVRLRRTFRRLKLKRRPDLKFSS